MHALGVTSHVHDDIGDLETRHGSKHLRVQVSRRDVIDHGSSGLLVPLRDPRAIELAVRLLIENQDLARRFGKAARRRVVAEFQVSRVNQSTLQQYDELLATPLDRKPFLQGLF